MQNVQGSYKSWESQRSDNYNARRRTPSNRQNQGHFHISRYKNEQFSFDRNRRPRYVQPSLPKYQDLAQFKMAPSVLPEIKLRPYVGSCCSKCLPQSRASIPNSRVYSLSVCNVLNIPLFPWASSYKNLYQALHNLNKNATIKYPNVSEAVLKNERVLESVCDFSKVPDEENTYARDEGVSQNQMLHIKKYLGEISSSVSTSLLRLYCWLLHCTFKRLFDGILVHKGQIETLKAVSQENVPIVYLPLHRSTLDYFLVPYILHLHDLKVPLVIVKDKYCIPFLGHIFRYLGAVFVKEKLDTSVYSNHLYSEVLSSYITECLKAGHSLEFFIEGQRSRTGKSESAKTSLLPLIANCVLEGIVDDVYIAPVSISYEKLLEGNFIYEQLDCPKQTESFFTKICFLWKIFHSKFGNVRLDIGQPFSLKEFLESCGEMSNGKNLTVDTPPSSPATVSEAYSFGYLESPTYSAKFTIKQLACHIMYDATCSTSLMGTHLLAFLFLTQYRKGATQQQLQYSFDWLRQELCKKKHDTAFTGESLAIIKRSAAFFGKNVVSSETVEMEWTSSDMENNNVKVTVYKPVIKLPYVLELQYYSNSVIPAFLLDSIVVNALYALVDVEICHFLHCDSKLLVFQHMLVHKASELADLLQFEFITSPPCADRSLSINEALEALIDKECLHVIGSSTGNETSLRYRGTRDLSFESSDEEDFSSKQEQLKIDLSEDSISHLEFMRSILSPCIESYWLAASALLKLVQEVKEESVFIQEMQMIAQDKLAKGLLAYEESFSAETLKNALKLFKHRNIVEHYVCDGVRIIYLQENYNSEEKLNAIVEKFEDFRK